VATSGSRLTLSCSHLGQHPASTGGKEVGQDVPCAAQGAVGPAGSGERPREPWAGRACPAGDGKMSPLLPDRRPHVTRVATSYYKMAPEILASREVVSHS